MRLDRWMWAALAMCLAAPVYAQTCVANSQVTVVGTLRAANGVAAINDILTLSPTNTGYIAGCGVNLPTSVTCATTNDGSVVGLADPLTTTSASAQPGGGSLSAGTYYVQYAWYASTGGMHPFVTYTLPSPEQTVILTAQGGITVNSPAGGLQAGAVGMAVYIGTASGGETLQGVTTGSGSFVQSAPLVVGAAVPSSNGTLCQVTANDAMWPVGTGYAVGLTDATGNILPKFQQQWQLNGPGSTINLSAGVPWYHGVVFYPSPILANPTNHGQQGITGPISLNGYNLISVGREGINTATPAYSLDVRGDINLTGLFRLSGNSGSGGQCLISGGSGVPVWGSCLGGSAYYQTMQANGVNKTQRPILDFTSAFAVSDDSGGTRTVADLAQQGGLSAGTYCQVTVNSQGIVTGATACALDQYASGTCAGAVSGFNVCSTTLAWPSPFADTSYVAVCTLNNIATGFSVPSPTAIAVTGQTTSGVTIEVGHNGSGTAADTFSCLAHHQ